MIWQLLSDVYKRKTVLKGNYSFLCVLSCHGTTF